jgi:hypothetical protein
MKSLYIIMATYPWKNLRTIVDGTQVGCNLAGDLKTSIGFIPVFETREDAEAFASDPESVIEVKVNEDAFYNDTEGVRQ